MKCLDYIQNKITKEQYKILKIHVGILFISALLGVVESALNFGMGGPIVLLVITVWIFTIISLLDHLNIIAFRKTVERLNRCALCGKTSSKERHDETGKVVKSTETKSEDHKETITEKIHDTRKAIPLDGVVISDKLICSDCLQKIQKISWTDK